MEPQSSVWPCPAVAHVLQQALDTALPVAAASRVSPASWPAPVPVMARTTTRC